MWEDFVIEFIPSYKNCIIVYTIDDHTKCVGFNFQVISPCICVSIVSNHRHFVAITIPIYHKLNYIYVANFCVELLAIPMKCINVFYNYT